MKTDAEATQTTGENQLWRSVCSCMRLLDCRQSRSATGDDDHPSQPKQSSTKRKISKSSKKSKSEDSDEERGAQNDDKLFGQQWFGYSRKKSKKSKKITNLNEIGKVTAVDTSIQKAKLGIKQNKRAPSSHHMKRMLSTDVFENTMQLDISDQTSLLPTAENPSVDSEEQATKQGVAESNLPEKQAEVSGQSEATVASVAEELQPPQVESKEAEVSKEENNIELKQDNNKDKELKEINNAEATDIKENGEISTLSVQSSENSVTPEVVDGSSNQSATPPVDSSPEGGQKENASTKDNPDVVSPKIDPNPLPEPSLNQPKQENNIGTLSSNETPETVSPVESVSLPMEEEKKSLEAHEHDSSDVKLSEDGKENSKADRETEKQKQKEVTETSMDEPLLNESIKTAALKTKNNEKQTGTNDDIKEETPVGNKETESNQISDSAASQMVTTDVNSQPHQPHPTEASVASEEKTVHVDNNKEKKHDKDTQNSTDIELNKPENALSNNSPEIDKSINK